MKILRASFVGYSMSSCMQTLYETLNPLAYGWQLMVFMFQYGIVVCNSDLRKK